MAGNFNSFSCTADFLKEFSEILKCIDTIQYKLLHAICALESSLVSAALPEHCSLEGLTLPLILDRLCVCMYVCMYMYSYVCMRICVYTCVCICVYVNVWMCMDVCMYKYVCVWQLCWRIDLGWAWAKLEIYWKSKIEMRNYWKSLGNPFFFT